MPTLKVKADENGRIVVGELCAIALAAIEGLEVTSPNDAATGKAIKVADTRLSFLAKVAQHDKLANYTLAVTITREPVTEAENVAIVTKAEGSKARAAADEAKELAERNRTIKLVQEAERGAADRVMQRDQAVLENTIKVLSAVRA